MRRPWYLKIIKLEWSKNIFWIIIILNVTSRADVPGDVTHSASGPLSNYENHLVAIIVQPPANVKGKTHHGTGSNPKRFAKGPVCRCNATTLYFLSLTTNDLRKPTFCPRQAAHTLARFLGRPSRNPGGFDDRFERNARGGTGVQRW